MVLDLKDYQTKLLDAFEAFLNRTVELKNPALAYWESTREVFSTGLSYNPLPHAEHVPYVCLRVPTGGGKTRIAGQSIKRITQVFLNTDYPLVVWLVPSEPILEQTLYTLRTRGELLHTDMRELFGAVNVLDIKQALNIQPSTLNTAPTIIVSTMQSFKRDTADGLRVYRQNGNLMAHFVNLPPELKGDTSLLDVIRLHQPFIIVDEAHNQGTPLALDTLVRLNPSCILELTATPDRKTQPSNVLRSVSAATLQAEDMLKLPLELATHPEWRVSLSEAIARIRTLEQAAQQEQQATGEVISPVIMLIQAERKSDALETFTPERVKQYLVDDYQIPVERVAIATGALDELSGKKLGDADYPQFIITVDKLREGWDCPFAYVLFSFRNTTSSIAVEQVLGRVLRMPHVKRKQHEALNRSYAYVVSNELLKTVQGLRDSLVQNGFERLEAKDLLSIPEAQTADLLSTQGDLTIALPIVDETVVTPNPESIAVLPKSLRDKLDYSPEAGVLTVKGGASPEQIKKIADTFKTTEAIKHVKEQLDQSAAKVAMPTPPVLTPAEKGVIETFPLLSFKNQLGLLERFETSVLLEGEWELSEFDPKLSNDEFSLEVDALRRAVLSISQAERLKLEFYDKLDVQQLPLAMELGWSQLELVAWLDRNIHFPYAPQDQKAAWLNAAVNYLTHEREFSLAELAYRKFRLRVALARKMEAGLTKVKQITFKDLIKDESRFDVVNDYSITLAQGKYAYDRRYTGFVTFNKHFYTVVGELNNEEVECAQRLDESDSIEWWVRNSERKPTSFCLPLAKGYYYPDFLAKLTNGTLLAIEYKGKHLAEYDQEKRQIGELWARRSDGKCRFAWVVDKDWQALTQAIKA